jgi:hypothetical protein
MNTICVKKLIILSYKDNIDCNGTLLVDNQEFPYKYSNLNINIDIRARSYEPYIELVKKIKAKLYGIIHGETWFYEFEQSVESWVYVMEISSSYNKENENIYWDIKVVPRNTEEEIPLYGLIIHAHKLSDLYDNLKKIDKKAEENFIYKSYQNFYLKGTLHSTNVVEKVYLYTIKNENELKEFMTLLLEKKVTILGYEYDFVE